MTKLLKKQKEILQEVVKGKGYLKHLRYLKIIKKKY